MGVKAAAVIVGLVTACAPALATDALARKAARTDVASVNPSEQVAEPAADGRHRQAVAVVRKHTKTREASLPKQDDDASQAPPDFFETIGWRLIEDRTTGARLGLPEKLVPRAGISRSGSRWTSAQGQIQVETFQFAEAALPALFEQEKKSSHREIASSDLKPDSFIITGSQGLKKFLVRAAARGSEVRGVLVLYDQATEGTMDNVAHAMATAFTAFPDPNIAPPPGLRRVVEYGSAIVITASGDLLAPAHVVDDCQTITVPSLGHAERVAEDKASDLALIRLYGAHNLVAAPIGGDAGAVPPGEITVYGVADPLAQAGAAGVTGAAARITAQGVEPAPKLGFVGAAAVDARGNLAGMVDVKPAVVAGSGVATPGAALVPVAAIRAFLQGQGVAPAVAEAGHAAIDQSIARVICVRK
jgi:hypothetical protein